MTESITDWRQQARRIFFPASAPHGVGYYAGWLLTIAYSACYLFTDTVANYISGFMAIFTAVAILRRHPYLRGLNLLPWLYAALALQLLVWAVNQLLYPEFAENSAKLDRLGPWFFLLPVALFTRGGASHVFTVWLAGLTALLLSPWLSGGGMQEISAGVAGKRIDFGIHNAQHMGMLFGVAFIGLTVYGPRILRMVIRQRWYWLAPLYTLVWLATIAALLFSQTRAIGLALLLTTLLGGLLWGVVTWRHRHQAPAPTGKHSCAPAMLIAAAVIAVLVVFSGILDMRFEVQKIPDLETVLSNPEALKEPSLRVRLSTWGEAIHWITERPLIGWGAKGRSAVVDATAELSNTEKQQFRHLHNSYLDTTVNFGLAGLTIYIALIFNISRTVIRSACVSRLQCDVAGFWVLFLIYWLIVNLFESYMFFSTGIYIFGLISGGTLALSRRPATATQVDR